MPKSQAQGGSAGNAMDYWEKYFTDQSQPGYFDEAETKAAQDSLGGFPSGRRGLLRRSQVMEGFKAIAPFIQQRAGFAHDTASQTQAQAASLAERVLAGQQAEKMDALARQGKLESDTRAAAAQRAETILQGQQAMQRLESSNMSQAEISAANNQAAANLAAKNNASREYLQNDEQLFTADQNASNRAFSVRSQQAGFNNSNLQLGSTISRDLQLGKGNQPNNATLDSLGKILNSSSGNGTNWNNPTISGWANQNNQGAPTPSLLQQSSGPNVPTWMAPEPSYYGSGGGGTGIVGQPQGLNEGTGEGGYIPTEEDWASIGWG